MSTILGKLPQQGRLAVNITVTADVNISAFTARQKVNDFVLSEISYMLRGGDPALVIDKRIVWRVPVILSLASRGDVGQVGTIDVDVETGQIRINPQLIAEITQRAETLALHPPSSSAA